MNILIVEPDASGHRMALYTRLVINAARNEGWSVSLLTTPATLEHKSYEIIKKAAGTALQVYFMEPVNLEPSDKKNNIISLFMHQIRVYIKIRQSFERIYKKRPLPDLTFVPGFEDFDKALAVFGSPFGKSKFTGILVSVKFHRHETGLGPKSRFDYVYHILFKRILQNIYLTKLFVVDNHFYDYYTKKNNEYIKSLGFLPEVGEITRIESKEDARLQLGLNSNAFVVLVYGSLSKRKGIDSLLLCADLLDPCDNIIILLAGVPDSYIKCRLGTPLANSLRLKGRLKEFLFFHGDEQERRVFSAADIIWIGYLNFFDSSGVIYQASSIGCPVISCPYGIIGWLTKKYKIGLVVDTANTGAVNCALRKLKEDPELCYKLGQNGKKLAAKHTAKSFEDKLSQIFKFS